MKKLYFLLVILCISCNPNQKPHVSYTISPIEKEGKPALQINMEFDANPSGESIVLFQDKAWGQENLHNTISDLKSDVLTEIIQEKDSQRFVFKHDSKLKKVKFTYVVQQDSKGELTTKSTYRPVIQKEYFHVFAHNLLMLPKDYVADSDSEFDVKLQWEGFDRGETLINSFGTNESTQFIDNTNEQSFHTAVFTGGDYRDYQIDIKGNKVVLGIRGQWEVFRDSTLVQTLRKTLEAQRDFWQDHSQEYFAVTVTPTFSDQGYSYQGTGLTNSFSTSATNNKFLEYQAIVHLFNHELQHNWTGLLIKNDNEEEQYWFSEGFTEYYTLKNIARNKIGGLNGSYFINKLNSSIRNLASSSVKEAPNSEIIYENFWKSYDYSKLPYRRGAIFAFYLDHLIQKESNGTKSLDDLMLAIKKDAVDREQKITHDYFLKKSNEFLNQDLNSFFDTHIIEGKFFDLDAIFTQFGFDYNKKALVFDLGIVLSQDNQFIEAIDTDSNAYKAGLRKGERIKKTSHYYDPNYEAEITILKNGKEQLIRFYPSKEIDLPTLKLTETNIKALSFE